MAGSGYPDLSAGKEWPEHMLGGGEVRAMLRETYAKITHHVAADQEERRQMHAALAWCRSNGNPHLTPPPVPE